MDRTEEANEALLTRLAVQIESLLSEGRGIQAGYVAGYARATSTPTEELVRRMPPPQPADPISRAFLAGYTAAMQGLPCDVPAAEHFIYGGPYPWSLTLR